MKKSLIALAVAGAMTAPVVAQADATLYGNVEVEAIFAEDADADVQVDDARIGVKGSDETSIDGVSSIYQIELEFNPEDTISDNDGKTTVRLAYAGLTGGFGTALAGRMTNPVDSTESLDMYSESVSNDYYFKNPDRLGNSIAYVSPTFSGLNVYAAIVMEGASGSTSSLKDGNPGTGSNGNTYDDGDREDLDGYLVGADFEMAGFTANLGYWKFDGEGDVLGGPESDGDDMDMWSLSLGYSWNALSFLLNYQETENYRDGAYADNLAYKMADTTTWALGAEYALENTTLGITYMDYEEEEVNCTAACGSDIEADEWGVYVRHALSKKASLKAEYSSADSDDTLYSEDILTLGYNVKF